jgi:hypothetical protein
MTDEGPDPATKTHSEDSEAGPPTLSIAMTNDRQQRLNSHNSAECDGNDWQERD